MILGLSERAEGAGFVKDPFLGRNLGLNSVVLIHLLVNKAKPNACVLPGGLSMSWKTAAAVTNKLLKVL